MPDTRKLTEHLFRRKYGEILATLLHSASYENFELAEEAVQTAFQRALEKWPFSGVPENPAGWLYQVARNALLEALRRRSTEAVKVNQLQTENQTLEDHGKEAFANPEEKLDDVATMILLCCNPDISPKAQVCLTLKAACGFSVAEIARALGMKDESVKKTITRAKEDVGLGSTLFVQLDHARIAKRFPLVIETLYAMFTEAYSASSGESQLRHDVAEEAIYLSDLLLRSALTPESRWSELHALIALMLLQMARFDARIGENGTPLRLQEQDRAKWNGEMINAGLSALELSKGSLHPTSYHIEARIAAAHSTSRSFASTDWALILGLYNQLLDLKDTLEVRLNRLVALRHAKGIEAAWRELQAFESANRVVGASFVAQSFLIHAIRADFLESLDRRNEALFEWQEAWKAAPTGADKKFAEQQMKKIA